MTILNSYKSIVKEASLFSGVQIILVLVALIRNMIIAKFLGVEAIGVLGILQNTIGVFIAFFSLGFPVLLVRSFALEKNKETYKQQQILKNTLLFFGILGSILFYLFIPNFSNEIFNHDKYDWILKGVAIVILFKQITSINISVLQGKQQLKTLAKVNVFSAVLGLIIAVPLYYFYNLQGVIYGFVIMYLIETIFSSLTLKKTRKNTTIKIPIKDYLFVLKESFLIGYGNVLALLSQFAILFYISTNFGSVETGLYNAGFSIINNYVALLFVAMSTGYLPRLIKLLPNKEELQSEISKQLNFSLTIIGLLALICIIFASTIITFLFSKDFNTVVPFLQLAVFGMIFKSFSWCLGFLIIAKADSKVLMFTGVLFNCLFALSLIYGYYLNGLMGVAYAFVTYNFIHLISIAFIVKYRYNIILESKTILFLIGILLLNLFFYNI